MKMYVIKENHSLLSGHKTFKWTWWYKDSKGYKSPKEKVIQNKSDLEDARNLFKEIYPDGKILFRDFAKQKIAIHKLKKI